MKLTKQKLKEIIKEELLNEAMDLRDPINEVREHLREFQELIFGKEPLLWKEWGSVDYF